MIDLGEVMSDVPGWQAAVPPETIAADLLRGRHALRRRILLRCTGALIGSLTVLCAVLALGVSRAGEQPGPSLQQQAATVALVRYTLGQPAGFTIDQVPQGWHVLASTGSSMILGDAADDGEDLDGSVTSFEHRIAVTMIGLESSPDDSSRRTYEVDGVPVRVRASDDGRSSSATVPLGNGRWLSVLIPSGLPLTPEQAAAFTAGVHATGHARLSHG